MSRSLFVACALAVAGAAFAARSSEQAVLWLEAEDSAQWGPAVRALLAERDDRLSRSALSSVLKRLEALEPVDRERVARGLHGALDERRVRDALARMLADADERVRNAAAATLSDTHRIPVDSPQEAAQLNGRLVLLLTPEQPEAGRIAAAVASLYVHEHAPQLGLSVDDFDSFRKEAARRSVPGTRADPHFAALVPLAEARDWNVRSKGFQALSVLIDERVHEALLQLARSPDEYVAENALSTLVKRGALEIVCPALEGWALSPAKVRAGSWRYQRLDYAGYTCAGQRLEVWIERYRQARDVNERADYRRLIDNAPNDPPRQRALLEQLEADPDAFLSAFARQRLEPRPAARETDPREVLWTAGKSAAVGLMLATLLLGAATFLWGFRLLQVRRLLRHLAPSKARSVAVGLVSLEGEVQPAQGRVLVHPDTDEACVYYTGADRAAPQHRFWLVDDSGRVLVEPRGALLVSEDGVLVPGERVRIIATAQRLSRVSDDVRAPTILRAGAMSTRAFARVGRALLQLVMDGPTTRMLFSDPRRMLLIWDDLRGPPFSSPRQTALLFLSFALAGTWMLVFLGATLTLASDRFAATLWGLVG
jgi:hypothetical protein